MLLQLFEHNEKAYRAAVQMMEECGKAAIVHPTGTGKSYIAFRLIEDNPEKVVIWLSPSEYIFKTQIENLKRQAPDISLANVHFYTYAKLMCCATEELEAIAGLNPTYNKKQFYIPEGFAHGFYVISDIAEVCFKVSDYWHPNDEIGIPWNDPELKINWPIKENEMPIIADKDLHYDSFSLLKEKLVQREE